MTRSGRASMRESGIDWIGTIPGDWEVAPLSARCNEVRRRNVGNRQSRILSLSYGKIVRRDVESNFGLLPESFETYVVVEPGDVVLRLTDLQNDKTSLRVGLAPEDGAITSAYVSLRPVRGVDSPFLFYLLHAYDVTKVFYGFGGGVRQSMKFDDLKRLPLVLPPLPTQRAIAAFLDRKTAAIDALIAKKERLIELLQEKRQALITQAVTKGLDPNVPMRDSGVEWLGEVPAHWLFVPTRFAAKMIQTGTTPPTDEPEYFEDANVPWYGPAAFGPALEVETPTRFVNHLAVSNRKVKPLPPGTVVVVTIGATVGRVAMLDKMGCTNQQITGIVFDPRIVFDRFAAFQFKRLETVLRGLASTTTLPILNQSAVGLMPVLVPPLSEQEAIVRELDEALRRIDGVAAKQKESIDRLREYRQALISAAVTGKIEIPAEVAA